MRWTILEALAVFSLVLLFVILCISSIRKKCCTYDELHHVSVGVAMWEHDDYGYVHSDLPQKLMAIPVVLDEPAFPPMDRRADRPIGIWGIGDIFFYQMGNDPLAILTRARLVTVLGGVVLLVIVWRWSRGLFGPWGGLLSLALAAMSPSLIAHSRLATTDVVTAMLFLAAMVCLWRVLHRLTIPTLLLSGLVMGLLFASKLSAVFILPMGLALMAIRLARPLSYRMQCFRRWRLTDRWRIAAVFGGIILVHAALVVLVIWAQYDFRYDARPNGVETLAFELPEHPDGLGLQAVALFNEHHLLPESYLNSLGVIIQGEWPHAFFAAGRLSKTGWWWFYPYVFAVKSSEALLAGLLLGAWAVWVTLPTHRRLRGLRRALYRTAPLWVMVGVYGLVMVTVALNFGVRHLLVIYPPLMILAGASVKLARRYPRLGRILPAAVAVWAVGMAVWAWPDYISYFNLASGGMDDGYRKLVDSNCDWGQDLPRLREYFNARGLSRHSARPAYLSYFGVADTDVWQIDARRLPGSQILSNPEFLIEPGVYAVSATGLQGVVYPWARWSADHEKAYQQMVLRYGSPLEPAWPVRIRSAGREGSFAYYLAMGRLLSWLRSRPPVDQVGHSILIYELDAGQLRQALLGPAPPAGGS